MTLATTIKAMRQAGVPDSQIIETVLAMEEERLAKDRARQAKSRNNKKNRHVTHVTSVTRVTDPSLDKEVPPHPPKKLNPTQKKNPPTGVKKKRGPTLCQPDWEPDANTVSALIAEGHTRSALEASRREMVDWSQSGGKRKHDWNATYRNWVRRNGKPRGQAPPANGLAEAFANTRRKLGIDDEPDSPTTIDITANP